VVVILVECFEVFGVIREQDDILVDTPPEEFSVLRLFAELILCLKSVVPTSSFRCRGILLWRYVVLSGMDTSGSLSLGSSGRTATCDSCLCKSIPTTETHQLSRAEVRRRRSSNPIEPGRECLFR